MERNKVFSSLEKIGWGKFNTKVFLQCGFAWMGFEMSVVNLAYVLQGCKLEYNTSTFEIGVIGSFLPFGLLIGALTFGLISDRLGRMYSFKSSTFVISIGGAILMLSLSPMMIGGSLLILGIGAGGEVSLAGLILAEFSPPSKRYFITLLTLFWGIGATLTSGLALLISLTNTSSIQDWRIIIGCQCAISCTCVIFRQFMIETPAYCANKGDIDRAEKILNIISLENTGKEFSMKDADITASISLNVEEHKKKPSVWAILKVIFSGKHLKKTVIFGISSFCISFAFTGNMSFMPEFLNKMSRSQAYTVIFLQQFMGIPGALFSAKMVGTRLGRKYTTILSFGIGAIFTLIFYFYSAMFYIIICSTVMYFFVMSGCGSFYTIAPESLATEVRGTGMAYVNICARLGGMSSPILTGLLLEYDNGLQISISIYAALYGMTGFLALFLAETKIASKKLLKPSPPD